MFKLCSIIFAGVLAVFICAMAGCKHQKPTIEDKDSKGRMLAVKDLTDQALLARVALSDEDYHVRLAALDKITDQDLLVKVILLDDNLQIRDNAKRKLADSLRLNQVSEYLDPIKRASAIATLSETDPALNLKMLELYGSEASREYVCIIHLKLATQESRIKSRFPRLRCDAVVKSIYGPSYYFGFTRINLTVKGEYIAIKLREDNITVAEDSWSTEFPTKIPAGIGSDVYFDAKLHGEDLLKKLLQRPEFTNDDLIELMNSKIEEVRIAVVDILTDQAVLAKVAIEDKDADVRKIAIEKLTDQAILAKIAIDAKDWVISKRAVEKLADQAILAKIAVDTKDLIISEKAVEKLTDQAVLARVMNDAKDNNVRKIVKDRFEYLKSMK